MMHLKKIIFYIRFFFFKLFSSGIFLAALLQNLLIWMWKTRRENWISKDSSYSRKVCAILKRTHTLYSYLTSCFLFFFNTRFPCRWLNRSNCRRCSCIIMFSHSQLQQKSDLVVSEGQMILVSHKFWNLSFYHCPLPSPTHPPFLGPTVGSLHSLVQLCFFLSSVSGSPCPYLCSFLPALSVLLCSSSHAVCLLTIPRPPPHLRCPLSLLTENCPFFSLLDSLHYYYSVLLFQATWMQAKARWWATCFFCWAMWTSAPCTSTSRNQRRRERPRSPTRGFWMKLARRGTGTHRGMEIWIFTSLLHSSEFLSCALQMWSLHLSAFGWWKILRVPHIGCSKY